MDPGTSQENVMQDKPKALDKDRAANPLSEHPVGTAVGGVTGAAASGAAIGSAAGPVGTVAGAAAGAAVGAVTGAMVADAMDPSKEENYWRSGFRDDDDAPAAKSEAWQRAEDIQHTPDPQDPDKPKR
jgi:phage tail tape-measure protein